MIEAQNIAQTRIKEFEQKFGTTTLHLAYHAALPVVLNAEFVHLLRINFFLDPPEVLDYSAEFDLLLSPFCHEIGDGLYEIDREVRDELLKGLIHTYKYEDRIGEIGELLRQYTYRNMPWNHRPALERAQELTALDALDHQKAVQWLERAEQSAKKKTEVGREWFVVVGREIERKKKIKREVELSYRFAHEDQNQLKIRSTYFSWLHFTDLHNGMKEQSWLWPSVREIFFDDLKKLHEKCGPWDLVLFTGDLTQRGSAEEFQKVNELLHQLWEHFKKLGSSPQLLAVPGNHDLVRPKRKSAALTVLLQWEKQPEMQEEFWAKKSSPYRKIISRVFKPYTAWWGHQSFRVINIHAGLLPGDFSTTIKKDGATLGIVGLNTSFLQLNDNNYKGKLALHTRQFHEACGGDGPAWVKQHHACLLLTHHPPAWLNTTSQRYLNEEIKAHGRFVVHLCGHMHETVGKEIEEVGTEIRIIWQGRSLFGLEYFGGHQDQRLHGYTAGRIELRENEGTLLFWPREARLQGGQRNIVPDYSMNLTDDQHTKPRSFKLIQPYIAEETVFPSKSVFEDQTLNGFTPYILRLTQTKRSEE